MKMTHDELRELFGIFKLFLMDRGLWDLYREHRKLMVKDMTRRYSPSRWISAPTIINWQDTGAAGEFNSADDDWRMLLVDHNLSGVDGYDN